MLLTTHLRFLARQSVEHRSPALRRIHLVTNVVGWLALATALAYVPVGPTNLGVLFAAGCVTWMAGLDVLGAALLGAVGAAWLGLPQLPLPPAFAVSLSLTLFTGFGLVALAGHVYFHEHADFLADEPRSRKLADTLHVIAFGAFQFLALTLLDRGWRPGLARHLRTEERRLCFRRTGVPWTNWGRTATCRAAVSWVPETTADVVTAVRASRAEGRKLRIVASGFSWPRFVPTDDALLFAERLDTLELDTTVPGRPILVAGAGATNRQINTFLARHGLAMPWNVVLETVRIGGTVSTGTHGSGRGTATMGDLLEAVELVDAAGEVRHFTPADGEVFAALRLALGSFGVVTRVWLRVTPMVAMRQVDRKVPLAEALADLERLNAAHDVVELYWFPFTDWAWIRTLDRTDAPVTHRPLASLSVKAQHYVQMWFLRQGTRFFARVLPTAMPGWIRFSAAWLRFGEAVVPLPDAAHYRQWIESMRVGCVEAAIPAEPGFHLVREAFARLQARVDSWAARGRYPLNLTVNLRFIGESGALLSPAWGRPLTAWIEALCQDRSNGWMAFSGEVLGDWLDLPGALPHWAKELDQLPGGIPRLRTQAGPQLRRFVAARDKSRVDPEGRFLNPLLTELFTVGA